MICASDAIDRPSRERRSTSPGPYSKMSASRPAANNTPGSLTNQSLIGGIPPSFRIQNIVTEHRQMPPTLGAPNGPSARSPRFLRGVSASNATRVALPVPSICSREHH